MRATTNTPQSAGREQGRILLVSDNAAFTAHRLQLERDGFVVVGVAGGAAALVALRRTRPHVVVADVAVSGITADELAHNLIAAPDGVPLVFIGNEMATFNLRNAAMRAGAFDYFQVPSDFELLAARLNQLVNVKLTIERLRAEAERDPLTELANRRRFRRALGMELERWRRYQTPCALLLLDIDFLKVINDKHGHPAGDVAIRHVAHALKDFSRDNDTPARLGGEEFALLLAGIDGGRAQQVAERLRVEIAAGKLETINHITVSIGVAACPSHADTERKLFVASDKALYRAKNEGRNCVCVADTDTA